MAAVYGKLYVSHGQFFIQDATAADVSEWSYDPPSGLVSALAEPGVPAVPGHTAVVLTGISFGDVRVGVEILPGAPDHLDEAAWEEIVDVSLHVQGGGVVLTVEGLSDPSLPEFPEGDLRVRVHARGRDLPPETPDRHEQYLIQAWPAPPAPEHAVKLTDQFGADLRAGTS